MQCNVTVENTSTGADLGDVVLGPGQRRAELLPRHGAGGQLGQQAAARGVKIRLSVAVN